ncbi:hypothetical protein [Larkinella sp.]|uniref:hypothetical protein n=1 Tax=Larkinella sp. TaxID=2034517 RepID=UPI003BAC9775
MISTNSQDILFDDLSILEKLIGKKELSITSANANCDCVGYSAPDDEDINTHQIAPTADPAH